MVLIVNKYFKYLEALTPTSKIKTRIRSLFEKGIKATLCGESRIIFPEVFYTKYNSIQLIQSTVFQGTS